MHELNNLTKKIEYLFLRILTKNLKDNKFTIELARSYAQNFLKIEPFNSIDDAKAKMTLFAQHHPDFGEIVQYLDAHIAEKQIESKIRMMRKLFKENKVEEVLKIASK